MAEDRDIKASSPTVCGAGTPYVGIFNAQGNVIRVPETGTPLGELINNFEYTYEEEKVDTGKIRIISDNPNLISLNELGFQQGLQLQWGYIYGNHTCYCGPIRQVIITKSEVSFNSNGVIFDIEFSDRSTLLKNAPPTYTDQTKGFVEYVKDLLSGLPIGIAVIDYGNKAVIEKKVAAKVTENNPYSLGNQFQGQVGLDTPVFIGPSGYVLTPMELQQSPALHLKEAPGVVLLDYNPQTKDLVIKDPSVFAETNVVSERKIQTLVMGTPRSKYAQIKDICRALQGGPYFMDPRDGKIFIHNLKSQNDIVKTYVYSGGNGELISFKITSNYTKSSSEVKQSTEINPDTKDVEATLTQAVVDPNHGNVDGEILYMDTWPGIRAPKFLKNTGRKEYVTAPSPDLVYTKEGIKAREEKPYKEFQSIKAAKAWYNAHPPKPTQAEIDSHFTNFLNDFISKTSSKEALEKHSDMLDAIPPFIIKRRVRISLGRRTSTSLFWFDPDDDKSTEAFKNAVASGQIDLNNAKTSPNNVKAHPSELGSDRINTFNAFFGTESVNKQDMYMRKASTLGEDARLTILEKAIPGLKLIQKGNVKDVYSSKLEGKKPIIPEYEAYIETDIEIELDGIDIAAGADTINLSNFMGNDIIEKVTNKVKATAQVLGDPILESSMNIEVLNVSDKFSGLWYSKKVTHTIGSDGYKCSIDFVERTIPMSSVTLKANWTKGDYGKELIQAFKKAKATRSYDNSATKYWNTKSEVVKKIEDKSTIAPSYSSQVQFNPAKGQWTVSTKDMTPTTYHEELNGKKIYNTRGQGDYSRVYQDYQDVLKVLQQ